MTETTMQTTVDDVMAELATLADPKIRAVNEKHGDDHAVNLTKLRGLAKRLKTQQDLPYQLWATEDTAARLRPTGGRERRLGVDHDRVAKRIDGLDVSDLLDVIETDEGGP